MAITITFMTTTKRRNSLKLVTGGSSCTALLKEPTTIESPTFVIRLGKGGAPSSFDALSGFNYCYCPSFNRYYWIVKRESETAVIANITCEVDVLATYRNEILATPAFVQFSQNKYNALIPDTRLPILASNTQHAQTTQVPMFDPEGVFAFTCITPQSDGYTGAASTLALEASELAYIADKLYADDFWESIKIEFYSPLQAVLGCVWTPIAVAQARSGKGAVFKVGSHNIYGGSGAKRSVSFSASVPIMIPYTDPDDPSGLGDFRNFDPYTRYYLTLPGVGTVELPMRLLSGHSIANSQQLSLMVHCTASPVTGDVTYMVDLCDCSGGILGKGVGCTFKGNFAVNIPVSSSSNNVSSLVQSAASSAGTIIGGLMAMGTPGGLIGAGLATLELGSGFLNAASYNTTVTGGMTGWSVNPSINTMIECTTVYWDISDAPSAVAKTIGRPYYHHVASLSECKGITVCKGAYVQCNATALEHDMLDGFINGANLASQGSYGGIIIE